jgi:carboxyl-terminal processing protease
VLRKFAFFNFSAKYFGQNGVKLPKGWSPDQAVLDEFRKHLQAEKVEFTEAEFQENLDWIKQQLKREMYITAFGPEESQRVGIEGDAMIAKAVESLPKAKALLETAKKMMVKRLSPEAGRSAR